MEDIKYKAFFTQETESGFSNSIESLSIADLEENDLLIKVSYSSLNYKDALSASGNKGVTRNYPHTPGIDAVGEVVKSNSSDFKDGDKIIVTGYDLGMNTYGGFGQYISIPATWAISLPNELSEAEAMSIGTAGLTAGLCVRKLLQNDLTPDSGDVLVTGASGGVGSVAVMVLSELGFNVVALTGKQDQVDYLESLGASSVIIRSQMEEQGKPLQKGISQYDLIKIAYLEGAKDKQIKNFSSGMKQRLKLALAWLSDVSIVLLDEPCSNLDAKGIEWYKKLANEYSKNRLVIVCSNNIEDEFSFCKKSIDMDNFIKISSS